MKNTVKGLFFAYLICFLYLNTEQRSMSFIIVFRSVFLCVIKGMTFEQAKGDIRLSGDIAQLGEATAKIAINDG